MAAIIQIKNPDKNITKQGKFVEKWNINLIVIRGIVNKFTDCACKHIKTRQKLMKFREQESKSAFTILWKNVLISKAAKKF